MSNARVTPVLRYLRKLAAAPTRCPLSDEVLLQRFAAHRDESAFETLLGRHASMVLGVCRRVLRNQHDAEDVLQATFLILARKAASIRKQGSVSCWLHGTAHRLALKAKAEADRRKAREARYAAGMPEAEPAVMTWEQIEPMLDDEIGRLAEEYRAPLVLCYLEGKTRDEAARQLGWSVRTLMRRLERGRELLRARLTRRGITMGAALLTVGLSSGAVSAAVPATLMSSTVEAATRIAAGQAAGVSAKVAALMEGVFKPMLLKNLKVTAVLLVLGLLGAGWGTLGLTAPRPPASPTSAPKSDAMKRVNEKNLLLGTWKVVRADAGGKHQARETSTKQMVVITADRLTIHYEDGETWEMSYRLFPGEKPRGIDLTPTNGLNRAFTMKGSYELVGNQLTLCFTLDQLAVERPQALKEGSEDRGRRVYVLEPKMEKEGQPVPPANEIPTQQEAEELAGPQIHSRLKVSLAGEKPAVKGKLPLVLTFTNFGVEAQEFLQAELVIALLDKNGEQVNGGLVLHDGMKKKLVLRGRSTTIKPDISLDAVVKPGEEYYLFCRIRNQTGMVKFVTKE